MHFPTSEVPDALSHVVCVASPVASLHASFTSLATLVPFSPFLPGQLIAFADHREPVLLVPLEPSAPLPILLAVQLQYACEALDFAAVRRRVGVHRGLRP